MSFATISVIGLGYIGLPTAAAFAIRVIPGRADAWPGLLSAD